MCNNSKTFGKTKQHFEKYLNHKISALSSAGRRCVTEVFYGVLQTGNVTLTDIGRSLNENILLKKTVERLSRNLSSEDLSNKLNDAHLKDIALTMDDDALIIFDDSDLRKPRAKKLEFLCPIRDGSTGETGMGYNLQYSCIVSNDRKEVKSLMTNIYSTKESTFYSQNDEKEKHLRKIFRVTDNRGIYVMDRNFSSIENIRLFEGKRKLVVRAKNRNIIHNKKKFNLYKWAKELELEYATQVPAIKNSGKHILKDTYFSVKTIKIEEIEMKAIVMTLEDHEPCIILTNQVQGKLPDWDFGKMVIDQYGCRWSVEEKIRFEKQQFNYENMRLQHFTAMKNMMSIINLISAFISHLNWHEISDKLIEVANVIKDEVRFEYYRITEGIKRIFKMRSSPVFKFGLDSRRYFPRDYQTEFWEL